ncbi:carnitine O-acetyltransferase yat1 [Friedmanniomyces endolithicus]|uniref:Carnitine O-acetyltransferase yat1 n=1 Tax=Friedmanniomyces endolithicus TaxID=329885 RepID=A0AAN6KJ10_9PEZI|nr:carnitine O-acetyltransferase yat1 [Friedmanniomyces endolithicus]KAK0268998.1 carnitine O-acetyltransferase yat1 [Friedmanniomyces endolithicus]KAK0286491.1 carnitine O-acetyltransferase yat1 [Friedmanniomyces endolithicus]KAK0303519.1 carnitine O-acetyltransferase yat1 [Friedmanniomyces endolithicus]KAK0317210.1 carnitine O-acetyltransferase yat1 [Friedmanniomyces endolithicus]
MSSVRNIPSIDQQLAKDQRKDSVTMSSRSEANAKDATQSFSKDKLAPLASHTNPESKTGVTFAAQDKLPKLPIPDLDTTCKKYIAALDPLQTAREHADTEQAVHDFMRSEGPELQEKLKRYATGQSSYIEQFWYDSYLNFDNPVVLNLNPFFLLEDDPTPARNNQVTRAASLVVSALSFVRAVRKEELPPDTVRGQPLDMYQYSRMFGTARIPTDNGCHIGQDSNAKHIVVLCRGQFYWFDVMDDNHDLVMTEKDVTLNLQVVVDDAMQTPVHEAAKGALGVLSTENRKIWSGLRELMSKDEGSNNSDCLNIVDTALFIVCLDWSEPLNSADLCTNMLCGTSEIERGVQIGTCTNRWYDKLQIIVCKNGSAGINFEHTGVDGHTVLRFASDVYTDTILRFARSINGQAPSLWASTSPDPSKRDPESFGDVSTTPHKLEWDMVPELSTALRFAETRLADLIQQNEFQTLEFMQYGKNFITSMGFSPDAFVQMAFQAAYYGMYGRLESCYEPAMTKAYFHGRTEAIRPVTPESVEFVRTFWAENPPARKIETLRKACERHTAITRDCAKAQGVDRHLYALMCLWQRQVDSEDSDTTSRNGGASTNGYSSPVSDRDPTNPNASPKRNSMLSETGGSEEEDPSSPASRSPPRPSSSHHPAQPLPAIFADPGWDKLNNTILSTSNCGNPSLRQFGFGPTSAEGFGIGYIIKDGSVSICASSKHRQTRRFVDAIEGYFLEMRRLLRAARKSGGQEDKGASRAREAEEKRGVERRGRAIAGGGEGLVGGGEKKEDGAGAEESDDDMGGYGFFDAGMLLQAIRASEEGAPSEKVVRRREVGKKLRLMEY